MLSTEDRINLRDELFEKFYNVKVIYIYKEDINRMYKSVLLRYLNKKLDIKEKYYTYVSEFRSEEEAKYCLLHKDDFTNHICPICGNICRFYNMHHGYRSNCEDKKCVNEIRNRTNEKLYGNANIMSLPEFQEKHKESTRKNHNCDYPTQDPAVVQKGKDSKRERYGDENYNNRKKASETCQTQWGKDITNPMQVKEIEQRFEDKMFELYGVRHALQHPDFITKLIQHNLDKYSVKWYFQSDDFKQKTIATNMRIRNVPHCMKDPKVIEKLRNTYFKKYAVKNPVNFNECLLIFNTIKKGLRLVDAYSNNEYFTEFVKTLYIFKSRLLQTNEIKAIFGKSRSTIYQRIHNLELDEYFDIQDSKLELQFRDFLIANNYKEKKDFKRHLFNLTTIRNTHQQLDFLFENCKLAFEIDDVGGHNISRHKINYHITKTKMAKDQHNIRLIHLWEWELDNQKIQNWILHILNQSKIQLNLEIDCQYDIRKVSKEDQITFLDQYSLDSYRNFDKCIGIYYNNELIQTISFKGDMLFICVKFGYDIIKGTKEVIQSYMNNNQLNYILTCVDLSKFTGQTYEDMKFELINYIKPFIISENFNETCKLKQLYNCGYNIYIFQRRDD